MSTMSMYLQIGSESVFTTHHIPADGGGESAAVLLVPPFGWEDVASYRARRVWGDHLSERGHHVVRFDLPGAGDSAGELNVPGRYETWRGAVLGVAAWLRTVSGAPRLTAIGIGVGGFLAIDSVLRAAADEAVLWATPGTGRRYLREFAAFSALEADRIIEAGGPPPPEAVTGVEAGGFVIDPDLAAAIAANDVAAAQLPAATRLLLLDRDGAGLVDQLAQSLGEAGLDVETGTGAGYADMITRPDWSKPPHEVFDLVDGWLARGEAAVAASTSPVPSPSTTLVTEFVQERPFEVEYEEAVLRGILAEPRHAARVPLTVVFVNAGAVRRTGPHRLWVEAARRWAEQGVSSLRLDLEGIGDSDGEGEVYRDVANFHGDRLVAQIRSALDSLLDHDLPPRFVVVGLCSGGSWAFHSALADPRVSGAVLVNPRILYWHADLDASRALRRRTRGLVQPRTWRRLVRGKISIARMSQFIVAKAVSGIRLLRRDDNSVEDVFEWQKRHATEGFSRLRDARRSAYFIFCDGEPLSDELAEDGLLDQPDRWPNVHTTHVPGMDHTLSPVWMHSHTHRALDDALRRELALLRDPSDNDVANQSLRQLRD